MYDFKKIEDKWKKYWESHDCFKTDTSDFSKPKYYALDMFPYPSGVGLHAGHPEGYTATDIISRMKRMQGYNVLHPMGWDAFGLPAEQYAIQTGNHPGNFTEKNIETFKGQLKNIGLSYDWSKEISTCDPKFYKWTQWIFKRLFEDGLAKKVDMPVNWCEELGTVLANDEVIDGKSERGGYPVVRKNMSQWVINITKYADRLLEGLDEIDWPEGTKEIQRYWIGKSIGAEVNFKVKNTDYDFTVFTTRCDTLFGATYTVLSPEHPLVKEITTESQKEEVEKYINECKSKSELERTGSNAGKTGVFTGAYAINPVNNKEIPIWISDYVLMSYGTGAIMAVPAHDTRDFEFATKFNIPIIQVLEEVTGKEHENEKQKKSIVAILYDKIEDKYLTINWHSKGGRLFVGGTIKNNETDVECAIREIKEETGYTDFTLKEVGFKINHHYYAYNKDTYFEIEATPLLFELNSSKQDKQNLDEDEVFDIEWVTKDIIEKEIKDELHKKTYEYVTCPDAMTNDGIHINSGFLDGLNKEEAINTMINWLHEHNCGKKKVNYRLRDWIFARQRYWGEPIPVVELEDGEYIALKDSELPLILPELEDYAPGKDGTAPLNKKTDWVNIEIDGKKGKRETSTMPGSAGSSWYFLRYIDPNNDECLADYKLLEHWMPVDLYIGGPEHATGHLLYSRMWNNYLYDKKVVPVKEPFKKLVHQGMILGANGIKMGKRYPEFVVNPNDVVNEYGADTLRLYEMFMGPLEADKPWNNEGVVGSKRFLERVYRQLIESDKVKDKENKNLEQLYHITVKKVTEDYENLKFNTAISSLMIFMNAVSKEEYISKEYAVGFIKLLYPIAPFICEEMYSIIDGSLDTLTYAPWPTYNEELTKLDTVTIAVSVNGKLRATFEAEKDLEKDEILKLAHQEENVIRHLEGHEIIKEIVVPNKIVNIVIK